MSRLMGDPREMEPCFLPRAFDEASETLLVFLSLDFSLCYLRGLDKIAEVFLQLWKLSV